MQIGLNRGIRNIFTHSACTRFGRRDECASRKRTGFDFGTHPEHKETPVRIPPHSESGTGFPRRGDMFVVRTSVEVFEFFFIFFPRENVTRNFVRNTKDAHCFVRSWPRAKTSYVCNLFRNEPGEREISRFSSFRSVCEIGRIKRFRYPRRPLSSGARNWRIERRDGTSHPAPTYWDWSKWGIRQQPKVRRWHLTSFWRVLGRNRKEPWTGSTTLGSKQIRTWAEN